MKKDRNNFAYIDGANLYKGAKSLGWELDYRRFRVWLNDKYGIKTAYLFIGLVPANKDLYTKLQEMGYVLVYKEVTYDGDGRVKGNCDADLVLKSVVDFYEKRLSSAVIVTSDGDYAGLVKFLKEKNVFLSLVSPSNKCSFLLRRLNIPIVYLDSKKNKLERSPNKEKAPGGDGTPQGSFS
ncbi:MAG: NYN domain-containing protein [bacterium]|nr:NYN domain-containing protein [bacterium]